MAVGFEIATIVVFDLEGKSEIWETRLGMSYIWNLHLQNVGYH